MVRYNDELDCIEKLSFTGPIRKCKIITKHFIFAFLYYYLHLPIFMVPRQSISNFLSLSSTLSNKDKGFENIRLHVNKNNIHFPIYADTLSR